MLAVTISFSAIWIPVILQILLTVYLIMSTTNSDGWFCGMLEVIIWCVLSPIIWMGYFTVLYFCK